MAFVCLQKICVFLQNTYGCVRHYLLRKIFFLSFFLGEMIMLGPHDLQFDSYPFNHRENGGISGW